jgi:hypothetical protein
MDKKLILIGTIPALLVGTGVYLLKPTEIKTEVKTVEVVKKEKENVYIDRVITKVVKPDGTIEEKTIEKDRTKIDRQERIDEEIKTKTITNPRYFSLGVVYKLDTKDFISITNYRQNTGIVAEYDTGILSSFILGSAFLDGTAIVGLGFRF